MAISITNIKTPPLFKRGGKNYSFRYNEDGQNKWKSTGESDRHKAKKAARIFLAKVLKGETPQKHSRAKLQELQDTWTGNYTKYKDLAQRSKKYADTIFNAFKKWADKRSKKKLIQVDNKLAKAYAIQLWDTGITAKTFNEHVGHLSRIFRFYYNTNNIQRNNPFNSDNVSRRSKKEYGVASSCKVNCS